MSYTHVRAGMIRPGDRIYDSSGLLLGSVVSCAHPSPLDWDSESDITWELGNDRGRLVLRAGDFVCVEDHPNRRKQ